MPTEEELLAAIDAAPDEDAPRLAHADWLEANGEAERAAYIRSSLSSERDTYYARVAGLPTVHGMSWECRRGYPEVVLFRSLAAFKKGWPLTAGQRVRHVAFSGLRGGAKLADEPALASITSLEMTTIDPAVILAVLRSPHLGPLRHLAVGPYPDDPAFFPALARLPLLAGLRSLHCSPFIWTTMPEEPIAALVASPHVARLRALRFHGWLSAGALRALWRSSSLVGVTVLEILSGGGWSGETNPGGLDDLGDGGAVPALERFRFEYPAEEKEGRALAGATRWTRLRELEIGDCGIHSGRGIGDAGAAALAGAAHFRRLERLRLSRCAISDAGAIALADSPYLSSLSSLDLSHNVIGRAGALALGRSERLPQLRALSLAHNPAPASLIAAVEARFRDAGPPVEEAPPAPAPPAVAAPPAPVLGAADEDGLVRAIWADPFDDAPRLVYADWLEEQGKPLHAATLRAGPDQRPALAARLAALMREDAPCAVTPALTDEGLVRVTIPVRSLRSKAFEERGPAWLRRHHVAEVCPDGTPGDWPGLFSAGWLAHTRGLSFQGRHFDALPALAASPHLAALASIHFGSTHRPWKLNLAAFFREADLRGLCRVLRPDLFLPLDALQAICEAPFAANLRHLHTGMMRDEELAYLSGPSAPGGLVTLALMVDGDSGVKVLADATGLGSLRNLDLSRAWFGDVGVDALAGSPLLAHLRRLRVTVRQHSTPALERLARAVAPHGRLVLAGKVEPEQREALAAILGERLVLE